MKNSEFKFVGIKIFIIVFILLLTIIVPHPKQKIDFDEKTGDLYFNNRPFTGDDSTLIRINESIIPKINDTTFNIHNIINPSIKSSNDAQNLIKLWFPSFLDSNVTIGENKDTFWFQKGKENIRVFGIGAYRYFKEMTDYDPFTNDYIKEPTSPEPWINGSSQINNDSLKNDSEPLKIPKLNMNEAYDIANKYVDLHGKLPLNFSVIKGKKTLTEYSNNSYQTTNLSYTFIYCKIFDGKISLPGERIVVEVYPNGEISYFFWFFREISEIHHQVKIKSAYDAIKSQSFENYIVDRNITNKMDNVTKIELGYYSPDYRTEQDFTIPVWILYINNSSLDYILINAVTGDFMS